jgi:hypothetical protein
MQCSRQRRRRRFDARDASSSRRDGVERKNEVTRAGSWVINQPLERVNGAQLWSRSEVCSPVKVGPEHLSSLRQTLRLERKRRRTSATEQRIENGDRNVRCWKGGDNAAKVL